MKIGIGCDEVAYSLKRIVIKHLEEKGIEVVDYGCGPDEKVLYPDVALAVAQDIAAKKFERGILICGTGIGMAITANKVPGVRAACCHDVYSAERSRKSNDAHILTMGAQVIGYSLALMLVDAWLASEFAGGRSQSKVDRMIEIDAQFHK